MTTSALAAGLGSAREQLAGMVADGGVVVLSGAGLSTESGIPDYRGPSGSLRRALPMTYQVFVGDVEARRRYWARSYLGWRRMSAAAPNAGHAAVSRWQRAGLVDGVITQNVDGLHQAAGATGVIELHGNLTHAVCLSCGVRETRAELDRRLTAANPEFAPRIEQVNPDGDAQLADSDLADFGLVDCVVCASDLLKPDVVFFGENVPRERVARAYAHVEAARALLVLGSSLMVMSGLRFVRRAAALGIPVGIVNQGTTRGDELASWRLDAPLGPTLSAVG